MHRNNVLLVFSGLKENGRVRQQIMRHRLTLNSLCCQFHKPKQIPVVAVCVQLFACYMYQQKPRV